MKTKIFTQLMGFVIVSLFLVTACSKEENGLNQPNESQKTIGIGDKVFTGNVLQKVFTNYNGTANFAENTGNNNFTGSNTPGSGGEMPGIGSGNFNYNGHNYPLSFGGYDAYGDGWFEVIFADQVFDIEEEPVNINAVGFDIRSGMEGEITSGNYYFSETGHPYTFDWAGIGIHINTSQEEYYDFIGGELVVAKSGNNYTFSFNGYLDNGKPVSGFYNGPLNNMNSDPDPNPDAFMNALVGGVSWNASVLYAYVDSQSQLLAIYGENSNGDYITLDLDNSAVISGASLSLNNGVNNAMYGNYNTGTYYYVSEYANVSISNYTGSVISGSFSFSAENYNSEVVVVSNGIFKNVSVTEY